MQSQNNIKEILSISKNIAIIGLSPDETKDSHIVAKYLQNAGYKVIPIYPKGDLILNQKVYHNLDSAMNAEKIDIIVVFRKSESVPEIADNLLKILQNKSILPPKIFWLQLDVKSPYAKEILEKNNIQVIENKCIKIEHRKLFS
ncbi:hypothetical protein CCY99_07740 [Helicobacter sp. 16-1353]|uniref:CoA-binding protein n=1 Tax=Helicobacter sp. 16-1353 TaxID=2004996 RepID=UPI000DCD022D|nr:CoA-binding protein [Helicobacter sp. 16-1353]RAX52273.1 hypothetical protein CCY99_07740 [Helicobacter sp. 16-1353]